MIISIIGFIDFSRQDLSLILPAKTHICKSLSSTNYYWERGKPQNPFWLRNKSIGNGQWVFIKYKDFMYAEHTTLKADLWENLFTVTVGVALRHGRNCGGVCNQVHIWQISPIYPSRVQSAQATLGNGPKYHLLFVGTERVPPDKCRSPWSNTYLHCKLNFMSSQGGPTRTTFFNGRRMMGMASSRYSWLGQVLKLFIFIKIVWEGL